ncbi:hypothetical protein J3A78_002114 [Streptomyces sp. PvR006]|uniref:hypothetical protein n=1 Tax=Streptomyces sp. PvR006 TaxID=2817860 RepID=UPI001AE2A27C|nr:hypothetical protein [Streptomyces sp. PvR006]MBP2581636.1 hypothetical protein [Streptomyces sp. PvR006]
MTDFLPAGPGWYVRETDGETVTLDPIVAWAPGVDTDDEPILLPFVGGGPHSPVLLLTVENLQEWERTVVYRPNHDPGADSNRRNLW